MSRGETLREKGVIYLIHIYKFQICIYTYQKCENDFRAKSEMEMRRGSGKIEGKDQGLRWIVITLIFLLTYRQDRGKEDSTRVNFFLLLLLSLEW